MYMRGVLQNNLKNYSGKTHMYINDKMIEQLPSSPIKDIITNNRQCFDAGFISVDVTVFYYFSSGMRSKYEATHSGSFCDELMRLSETDCQRAFAYGCWAHLIQDSVSHNEYVYERIKTYFAPNFPFHPIFELTPEAHIIKTHGESYTRLQYSLKPLLNDPILMNKFQQAVSKLTVINVKDEVKRFDEVIGDPEGFYTRAFGIPDVYKTFAYGNRTYGLIFLVSGIGLVGLSLKYKKRFFLILPIIFLILPGGFFLIGGIAGITSNADFDEYMNKCIDRSISVFQSSGWVTRYNYDPTGFAKLEEASSSVMFVWYLIGIGLISLISLYVYLKLKRKRR